ncbi:Solute carrier family 22 member 3, partial [Trichinella sp. T6]
LMEQLDTGKLNRLLQQVGGFGKWQRLQLLLLAPSFLLIGWCYFAALFISQDASNFETLLNVSSNNLSVTELPGNESLMYQTAADICARWRIVHVFIENNTTKPKKYMCVLPWLLATHQAVFLLGSASGHIIFTLTALKFGPKKILIGALALHCVCCFTIPFNSYLIMFDILRFFDGFSVACIQISALCLILGITSRNYHPLVIILLATVRGLSNVTLSAVASSPLDWTELIAITAVSSLFLFSYIKLIPESPLWFVLRGERLHAERMVRQIAHYNGHRLRIESIHRTQQPALTINTDETFFKLTDVPPKCKSLLCEIHLSLNWLLHGFLYEMTSLLAPFIAWNIPEVGHSLSGIVEMFSALLAYILWQHFPTRTTAIFSSAMIAFFLVACLFGAEQRSGMFVCILLAKLCAYTTFLMTKLIALDFNISQDRFAILIVLYAIADIGAALATFASFQEQSALWTTFPIGAVLAVVKLPFQCDHFDQPTFFWYFRLKL